VRCIACDKILNDFELTKKYASSGQFIDMCNRCSAFLSDDHVLVEGNVSYASIADLEELAYVEDGEMDCIPDGIATSDPDYSPYD